MDKELKETHSDPSNFIPSFIAIDMTKTPAKGDELNELSNHNVLGLTSENSSIITSLNMGSPNEPIAVQSEVVVAPQIREGDFHALIQPNRKQMSRYDKQTSNKIISIDKY